MSVVRQNMLDIEQIKRVLPHRYPFLFLDKVLDYKIGESAHAIKNLSADEWFFAGHFPNEPIMPGVLIIEALAQLAGIAMLAGNAFDEAHEAKSMYFVKIESATFKAKVVPGDRLNLFAQKTRALGNMCFFDVHAEVNNKVVAQAKIVATVA